MSHLYLPQLRIRKIERYLMIKIMLLLLRKNTVTELIQTHKNGENQLFYIDKFFFLRYDQNVIAVRE